MPAAPSPSRVARLMLAWLDLARLALQAGQPAVARRRLRGLRWLGWIAFRRDPLRRLEVRRLRAATEWRLGYRERAVRLAGRTLWDLSPILGHNHPSVLRLTYEVALASFLTGDSDAAYGHVRRLLPQLDALGETARPLFVVTAGLAARSSLRVARLWPSLQGEHYTAEALRLFDAALAAAEELQLDDPDVGRPPRGAAFGRATPSFLPDETEDWGEPVYASLLRSFAAALREAGEEEDARAVDFERSLYAERLASARRRGESSQRGDPDGWRGGR